MSHILMDGAAKAESSMRSCKHRARGCHGRLGLLLLFSFFGFAAQGAAQSNPQSGNQPTGKIHGIVVRQGTDEPIEGVLIGATPIKGPLIMIGGRAFPMTRQFAQSLIEMAADPNSDHGITPELLQAARDAIRTTEGRPPDAARVRGAVSSENGEFTVDDIPAGVIEVSASAQNHFGRSRDGRIVNFGATVDITVTPGKTTEIRMALIPGVAISGRAFDPKGKPLIEAEVFLLERRFVDGALDLKELKKVIADDRGSYRFFGLPPGEYYVAARPARLWFLLAMPGLTPLTTFQPDATDAMAAPPLALGPGEDRSSVDIHLRTARSAKISGKVIDALAPDSRNGEKGGATSRTAVVSLAPRSVTVGKELAHVVEANPDGSFEFSNVPPGAYEIYARLPAPSGWGAEGPPERAKNPGAFGHTAVDARGEDIEGITINVRQGVDVKGRVFVDGIPTAANLHLSLRADETAFRVIDGDTSGAFSQVNSYEPKIAENGSFSIPLVPEGRYRLRASFGVGAREKSSNPSSAAPLPLSAYIEDVVQGGQSVYDDGLRAGPEAPEQIDVIIRTNGGSIAGDVIAADKTPRALAVVTLIPPPLRRRNGALYKTALTDERGHFEIVGVPPGEYKLLAFEFVEPGSLQNAEVLEKYESRAVAATVTTGTQTRVHVDLIPTLQ